MNIVESTHPGTVRVAHQARWIKFRDSRGYDSTRTWIFTDGSSLGGYAAVVVRPEGVTSYSEWEEPTSTKNVGAELNGLLLALRSARKGESLTIVSDYLGVAAWMTSNWKIKDPEVAQKVGTAKALIASLELDVDYIHHKGHQRDDSDFTKMNTLADKLAGDANPGK